MCRYCQVGEPYLKKECVDKDSGKICDCLYADRMRNETDIAYCKRCEDRVDIVDAKGQVIK